MAKIFISYAKEDQDFVSKISEELNESNHTAFFAGGSISPGEKFQETISNELKNSDVIVFVMSEHSASSRWVMTEIGIALGYWEERGKPLIIPVVLDEVSIPPQITKIQSIIRNRQQINKIIEEILSAIDKWLGLYQAKEDEKIEAFGRVEENAATYIKNSLNRLQKQETRYRRVSYFWYVFAFFSILGGIAFGIVKSMYTNSSSSDISSFLQFVLVSVLVIGLIFALSRFSFILGKSFMVESLRNSDRIHAISFGEFYLKAYGTKANWKEIKEVFQHWNIDKGSDFINQNPKDFDPEILKIITEFVAKIHKQGK